MLSFITACAAAALCATAGLAAAQPSYPARPIRMLVPFAPGGGTDISARVIGQKMTEQLHQTIIVDNRTGASGHIAMEITARAAPDGYTLIMSTVAPMAFSPALFTNLTFDPLKDYAPVALASSTVFAIVVPPSLPAKSVKELIALAKSQPGKLSYASGGTGGASHIATELFQLMAGTSMVHVPYKGAGPGTTALLSGEVDAMFNGVSAAIPHVKAGRLRALAVSSAKRTPLLPDLPTVAESGLKYDTSGWYALVAPARTPRGIVTKLQASLHKAMNEPEMKQRLATQGIEGIAGTPEELGKHLRSELEKWASVVKAAGIKPN